MKLSYQQAKIIREWYMVYAHSVSPKDEDIHLYKHLIVPIMHPDEKPTRIIKHLPHSFDTITFLTVDKNDMDYQARISTGYRDNTWFISNLNMPYGGTLSYLMDDEDLRSRYSRGLIDLT